MTTFHYDKDFQTSVSLGVYSDIADDGFIGYNDNLQANVESTLSPLGLGILTTPSNSGELLQMRSTSTASVILRTRVRTFGRGWWTVGRWGLQTAGTSAFLFETADKPSLDPLTDIMITAEASANAVDVSGRVAMQFNNSRIGG